MSREVYSKKKPVSIQSDYVSNFNLVFYDLEILSLQYIQGSFHLKCKLRLYFCLMTPHFVPLISGDSFSLSTKTVIFHTISFSRFMLVGCFHRNKARAVRPIFVKIVFVKTICVCDPFKMFGSKIFELY